MIFNLNILQPINLGILQPINTHILNEHYYWLLLIGFIALLFPIILLMNPSPSNTLIDRAEVASSLSQERRQDDFYKKLIAQAEYNSQNIPKNIFEHIPTAQLNSEQITRLNVAAMTAQHKDQLKDSGNIMVSRTYANMLGHRHRILSMATRELAICTPKLIDIINENDPIHDSSRMPSRMIYDPVRDL